MSSRSFARSAFLSLFLLPGMSPPLAAASLEPAYDLQGPGLAVAQTGIGLLGLGAGSRNLALTLPGRVELALLYWAGRDRPCPVDEPGGPCLLPEDGAYKDQVLRFDGLFITGTRLGAEAQPDTNAGPINNLGYFADVTEQVRARGTGRQTFPVSDGDRSNNLADLDGAGLLVVYTDPAHSAPGRVIVYHGLDFAYGEDRSRGPMEVTEPITFNHGAARASLRRGKLVIFAGDAVGIGPDRIDVSRNASLTNRLDSSAGAAWDADLFPVDLPAGAGATTVQIFSEPIGKNPDSLLWVAAALWLPLPVPSGCEAEFWNRQAGPWGPTGLTVGQRVANVFREANEYGPAGTATVRTALRFQEGPGLLGAAKRLLAAGVAAVLNAGHPKVEYPLTQIQVITLVDTALRGDDAAEILALAAELEDANEAGCPLD